LAIKKYKLVIFIDGDFFFFFDWKERHFSSQEELLESYSGFCYLKIKRNVERDKEVTNYYKLNKWTILRFWASDIKKDLNKCIVKTIKVINKINTK
jgi:DNA mismatch endonuclease (patch repair protein)